MSAIAGQAPSRTLAQRLDALAEANRIRSHRAELKKKLKRREITAAAVMRDPLCASWKVFDLLVHVPRVGRVKANKILKAARISPSKRVGGLSERQRVELSILLAA